MSKLANAPDIDPGTVEMFGPCSPNNHYKILVGGYRVPYVECILIGENTWQISIRRGEGWTTFPEMEVEDSNLKQWAWFLAQAMAMSAGYYQFGEGSRLVNPYMLRVFSIDTINDQEINPFPDDDGTIPPDNN